MIFFSVFICLKLSEKRRGKEAVINQYPVVVMLPGTDETAFDHEMIDQCSGEISWLEVSFFF